jgi:hypothetical protein
VFARRGLAPVSARPELKVARIEGLGGAAGER